MDGWKITSRYSSPWASWQIRKIAGCACAENAGNVFPSTAFKGNRLLAIPAWITSRADARAVMHVGIPNPHWQGKRSRHSRRMRNPQFYVSRKRSMAIVMILHHWKHWDNPNQVLCHGALHAARAGNIHKITVNITISLHKWHLWYKHRLLTEICC